MSTVHQIIVSTTTALVLALSAAGGAAAKPTTPVKAAISLPGEPTFQRQGAGPVDLLQAPRIARPADAPGVEESPVLARAITWRCYFFFTCSFEISDQVAVSGVRG